ncbi:hypothetical protein GE061_011837 [Apolygus lucorum]|uniref:Uncharacterized protein n=1 Tax=Apolygus lucorum TaxID=248454 RepID=A0A8S9Y194_APOLU|nr:hypothetical protein GE061_011837 [Apolygus lucorum]
MDYFTFGIEPRKIWFWASDMAGSITTEDINEIIITDETTLLNYTEPFPVDENSDKIGKNRGPRRTPKRDLGSDITEMTQEILDMISPPLEFHADGSLWRQQVSIEPMTRADVHKLGENLNIRLRARQARSAGICAVRLDLFSQLFDELIRQVTLNCGERGLLLLRIRDELQLTLATHAALFEGSVAFGSKKASQSEEGQDDFNDEIETLNGDIDNIKKDIRNLKFKYQMMEIRAEEIKVAQQKKHKDEIAFLNKTNQQLKDLKSRLEECIQPDSDNEVSGGEEAQLESIIAPKK